MLSADLKVIKMDADFATFSKHADDKAALVSTESVQIISCDVNTSGTILP